MYGVSEILLIEGVNVEIDNLEGELKKRFPRQPKRVAAYFAPLSAKRSPERDPEQEKGAPETTDSWRFSRCFGSLYQISPFLRGRLPPRPRFSP